MGLLGKVVGAGLALAGVAAGAALLSNPKKKMGELDEEFSEVRRDYEKRKKKLSEQASAGNKHAQKKLERLEEEFAYEEQEYKREREKLEAKIKNSPFEKAKEKSERKHAQEIEKMEKRHIHEMEKLEFTALNSSGMVGSSYVPNSSEDSHICENCKNNVEANAKFCAYCGKEIQSKKFCSKCGRRLKPDSKFCMECGERV